MERARRGRVAGADAFGPLCSATRKTIRADADIVFLLDVCLADDPYAAKPKWLSAADRRLYDHRLDQRDHQRAVAEQQNRANNDQLRQEKADDKQREIDRMVRERQCAREGGASAKCQSTIDPMAR